MMKCEQMESQFIGYLDGRVTVRERREVEEHLASCASCRARVEGVRGVWKVLEETPAPEPSAWFDARLRQRIGEEPAPGLWTRMAGWLPQPRLALASVALVAVGFWAAAVTRPQIQLRAANPAVMSEDQNFQMIKNMQVLENYDVLKDLTAPNGLQGD
ncbi:MAG TPA: zf-HC2 domain-containing protein [Candidatus Acidoferrales bacterium]|nr:zf-HC2 domain-containing protein [Candidatus Acidoferrales bacterium]